MTYMINDARVKSACKRKRNRRTVRRILAAAACLLIAAVVATAAIPSARAAIGGWLLRHFTTQDYMGEGSGGRTAEPGLDAVITKADSDGRSVTITEVFDSEEARAKAEGFGLRLDEIAYTGSEVYITGWFTGDSGKFLLDQRTGGDTARGNGEWTEGSIALTLPDGAVWYGILNAYFTPDMDAIVSEAHPAREREPVYDEAGRLVTDNAKADKLWYEWLKSNELRFTLTFTPDRPDAAKLTGQLEAGLSFWEYYYDAGTDSIVTLFRADLGSVAIDADAYLSVTSTSALSGSVTLGGTHRMFVREWEYEGEETYVTNSVRDLDMTGLTVAAESVSFTPTGPEISLRLTLPESWTRAERAAAASGGPNWGLGFIVLLDGEEVQHPFSKITHSDYTYTNHAEEQNDPLISVPRVYSQSFLAPSAWDEIETVTFIPYLNWPGIMYVVGIPDENMVQEPTRMEPGVTVRFHVNAESDHCDDWHEERLDEYALTIRLTDYR